jgi:hypothetical protein
MSKYILALALIVSTTVLAGDVTVEWQNYDDHLYDSFGNDLRTETSLFHLVLDLDGDTAVASMITNQYWAIGSEHKHTWKYGSDDDLTFPSQNANWTYDNGFDFGLIYQMSLFDESQYASTRFYFRFYNADQTNDATEVGLIYNAAGNWITASDSLEPAQRAAYLGRMGPETAEIEGSTDGTNPDGWATMAVPPSPCRWENAGVSNVTVTSAVPSATLIVEGQSDADVTLYWGQTQGLGKIHTGWDNTNYLGAAVPTGLVDSVTLSDLTGDTTYYYRFYATNGPVGEGWSEEVGFTTLARPGINNGTGAVPAVAYAVLSGNMTNGSVADVSVFWGDSDGGTNKSSWAFTNEMGLITDGAFTTNTAAGLLYGVSYYYRCYATNALGDDWADSTTSFVSLNPGVGITNEGISDATQSGVDLDATLYGTGSVFDVWVFWSTNDGAQSKASWLANGESQYMGSFTNQASLALGHTATNLDWQLDYYYNYYASNQVTELWGSSHAFHPNRPLNVDNAGGATNVAAGIATLQGELVTGDPAQIYICWGDEDGGTTSTSAWDNVVDMGTNASTFSTNLTGFMYGVTYYYRCYASNYVGQVWASSVAEFLTDKPESNPYVAGLLSGTLSGNINTTTANPGNGDGVAVMNMGPRRAKTQDWGGNTTYVYTGEMYFDGTGYFFIESLDDKTWLKIDETVYINDSSWNNVTDSGLISKPAGWYDFEVRMSNGSGGSGWVNRNPGFQYHNGGGTSDADGDNDYPEDPGDASLFRYDDGSGPALAVSIINLAVSSDYTTTSATFNALMMGTQSVFNMYVYWGTSDGGAAEGAWGNTNYIGSYTNVGSANVEFFATGLSLDTEYHYTFAGQNATTNMWATPSTNFTTLGPEHMLPFRETFEDRTLGSLDGQYGWTGTDAQVQDRITRVGSGKAACITNDTGEMSHAFFGGRTNVWTDFYVKPSFGDTDSTEPPPENSTSAFFVNTNGLVVAFDGQTTTQLSHTAILQGDDWVRFTVRSDYVDEEWDLYLDGAPIGMGLGFYTNASSYRRFGIRNAGASTNAYVDSISILLSSPLGEPGMILLLK